MDITEVYDDFQSLRRDDVGRILDEELGLYTDIIKPVNTELKAAKIIVSLDEDIDGFEVQDAIDTTIIINIIHRIILWDRLFSNSCYTFDETKLVGTFNKDVVRMALLAIINSPERLPITYSLLLETFGRWSQLRDLLFSEQKAVLDRCISAYDYEAFLKTNPYQEFSLFARYRLSLINNTPFNEAKTAIDRFPNSDILPIKEIKTLFQEVNGFHFMWKGDAAGTNEFSAAIRRMIIDVISNFKHIPHCDNVIVQATPIDYCLLRGVLDCITYDKALLRSLSMLCYEWFAYQNASIVKSEKAAIFSTVDFFKSLIFLLNSFISGVHFSFLNTKNIVNSRRTRLDYLWVEDEKDASRIMVIRGNDGKVFSVNENVFAGCLLMLTYDSN